MDVKGVLLPEDYCGGRSHVVDLNLLQAWYSQGRHCHPGSVQCSKTHDENQLCAERGDTSQNVNIPCKNMTHCMLLEFNKYFEDAIKFLHNYSWVYDFQVTNFLLMNPLKKVPTQWTEYFLAVTWMDLNELPSSIALDGMPSSLGEYVTMCQRLSLPRSLEMSNFGRQKILPEMNPKKSHEVLNMTELVRSLTKEINCNLIVDVGAGLGYVSAALAKESDLHVLALECSESLTHGTEVRRCKQDANFLDAVTFRVEDSQECFMEIQNLVRDKLGKLNSSCSKGGTSFHLETVVQGEDSAPSEENLAVGISHLVTSCEKDVLNSSCNTASGSTDLGFSGACMIGLHCCGSLTPTMLKMFLSSDEFRAFVCVSCCYHAMEQEGSGNWKHFPLSHTLKSLWQREMPDYEMSVYGLRLAAQETRSRWEKQKEADHDYHSRNVGFRALLELICDKDGINLQKNKRRLTRKGDMKNLQTFAECVMSRTNISNSSLNLTQRLQEEYQLHIEELALVEPFTALQVCLQSVIESLILIDRVLFLQESGIHAMLVPVFDDNISPRNMAIIAVKP